MAAKKVSQERMLLRIFSGDDEPVNELPEEERKRLQTFVTYGGRKMDDLLRCLAEISTDCFVNRVKWVHLKCYFCVGGACWAIWPRCSLAPRVLLAERPAHHHAGARGAHQGHAALPARHG